ncbi:hypothetical protein DLREEDagr8_03640 [Dongia sp. agr-C8]
MRAALTLCVLGTSVLLASCAGREPNPTPVAWVYDKYYTCQDIREEKDRIAEAMRDRNVEQASLESRDNDLMARTIPFLAPGVAAIEETSVSGKAKTPQEVENDALLERDKHLDGMAADRGC